MKCCIRCGQFKQDWETCMECLDYVCWACYKDHKRQHAVDALRGEPSPLELLTQNPDTEEAPG